MKNLKTVEELLIAYADGERYFIHCDIEGSFQGEILRGIVFQDSFLLCDFRGANLTGARFENCNLKTCSFREANLMNAIITKCAVECIDCVDANIKNVIFEGNYYMGSIMNQSDLRGFF